MKRSCVALVLLCLLALPVMAAAEGWEIVRADYGSGNNWVDVTDRVRSLVQDGNLKFRVSRYTLANDGRQGRRVLRLQLKDSQGRSRQVSYRDRQQVNLQINAANYGTLRIDRAIYGTGYRNSDVTSRLSSMVRSDQLDLRVDNNTMGGDPAPNQSKTLTVQYAVNGRANEVVINEGDMLRLGYGENSGNYGTLRIDRATYGSGYRSSDVTGRLNSQIQGNQLNLQVNNDTMGGDPAPNQSKTLTVQYSVNGRSDQVVINEGDMLRLSVGNGSYGTLRIDRAIYGSSYRSSDVTARLSSQVRNNQLDLRVDNNTMGGDPAPSQSKTLRVDYTLNGRSNQAVINEGDTLRLGYGENSGNYGTLRIDRATYGSGYRNSDVTGRLNSRIQGNQLNLQVNNDTMGGDPAPNQSKTLRVDYTLDGRINQVTLNEGDALRLGYGDNTSQLSRRVRCESQSNDYGRTYCAADTRSGIRLSRRLSDSECVQGSSWGYDASRVWVDKGCRADFELGNARYTGSGAATTIPNGTELSVRTNEAIDSKTATAGQTYSAVVSTDVVDGFGAVTIPKGSDAELVIRSADGGGITSASELVLDVTSVTISGTRYLVSTGDLEQQGGQGVGANKKTAIMVGGGAALGTLIGAIVGGGKGAAIGAAIGAGAGLGTQVLTRGKEVRVPAETLLTFRLDQDLRLQSSR